MTSRLLAAQRLFRPWGSASLPAPFAPARGERIGEIRFEPAAELPDLLVKYLFTDEDLSVQVHPSSRQAITGETGKDESWLITDARPGARIAIGFHTPVAPDVMRAAALDGSIMGLLDWREVRAGDFFYIPSGTVHALGAGLNLIEFQQNSDTTYRLYDYGRPRELHLDRGIAVASGAPYGGWGHRLPDAQSGILADGPFFRVEQLAGLPDAAVESRHAQGFLCLPRRGSYSIAGEMVHPGQCARASRFSEMIPDPAGVCILVSPA